jgi:hypothetical protein
MSETRASLSTRAISTVDVVTSTQFLSKLFRDSGIISHTYTKSSRTINRQGPQHAKDQCSSRRLRLYRCPFPPEVPKGDCSGSDESGRFFGGRDI